MLDSSASAGELVKILRSRRRRTSLDARKDSTGKRHNLGLVHRVLLICGIAVMSRLSSAGGGPGTGTGKKRKPLGSSWKPGPPNAQLRAAASSSSCQGQAQSRSAGPAAAALGTRTCQQQAAGPRAPGASSGASWRYASRRTKKCDLGGWGGRVHRAKQRDLGGWAPATPLAFYPRS
jgi:hypothetical protein